MNHTIRRRPVVAALAALTLMLDSSLPLVAAASQTQTPTRATPSAVAPTTSGPIDGGWPRTYALPSGGSIVVYQPQTASWDKQAHLVDVRRIVSYHAIGRYNLTSVGLFVWRLNEYPVTMSQSACLEEDGLPFAYSFSFLGNDAPLFARTQQEVDPTHIADESNLPVPRIQCIPFIIAHPLRKPRNVSRQRAVQGP